MANLIFIMDMSTKTIFTAYKGKPVILMYRFQIIFLILLVGSGFVACSADETDTIDPELLTYFERFESEANARNIIIDFDKLGISGQIVSIRGSTIVGQCVTNDDGPDRILIEQDYWKNLSDLQREFLVFHELGHCALGRIHNDEKYLNGSCRSMMHSSAGVCRSTYSDETRDSYLNELFGE